MTMEKVVKSVKYDKPINSQWGEFHKWLLEFEDGFRGEYLSKTETQNLSSTSQKSTTSAMAPMMSRSELSPPPRRPSTSHRHG